MAIDKEGQSVKKLGIYLPSSVFSHDDFDGCYSYNSVSKRNFI